MQTPRTPKTAGTRFDREFASVVTHLGWGIALDLARISRADNAMYHIDYELKMSLSDKDRLPTSIFLIERSHELRSTLIDILEAEGYVAIGAESVESGLSLLSTLDTAPNLIICAIEREGMTASQFLAAVQDATTDMTGFLFMTTHPEIDILPTEYQRLAAIQKPFLVPDLLNIIQAVVNE